MVGLGLTFGFKTYSIFYFYNYKSNVYQYTRSTCAQINIGSKYGYQSDSMKKVEKTK